MKFFNQNNILNVQQLRSVYYQQIVNGSFGKKGNYGINQNELNKEYEKIFSYLKKRFENSDDFEKATKREKQAYDFGKDKKIRQMLFKLSNMTDLDVEVIGTWIWVSGDTITHKKELHNLGLRWASKKQMWYIHYDDYFKSGGKHQLSMEEIREKYSFGFQGKALKPAMA